MKHMSPRLLEIAIALANANLAVPAEWTKAECTEAINRLDNLIHALIAHAEAKEEASGKPCHKTGDIIIALMDQMTDIEEAMQTR
jgi:hypothetical protein